MDGRRSDGCEGTEAYERLEERAARRTAELETLLAVQQAITRRREPEAVLQLVADEARHLTGSARGLIFLLRGDELEVAVTAGRPRPGKEGPELIRGFRMPVHGSLTGQAILGGRAFATDEADSDPRVNREIIERTGVRNLLVVPMMIEGSSLGAIVVADKEGSYSREDERLLSLLAAGAAIALENARLYQEELERRRESEERRRVAEGLRDILALLNSDRSLSEVLDAILEQAARVLETEAAAVYRLNEEEQILYIQRARGLPQDYVEGMLVGVGYGAVGVAVEERRPVVISVRPSVDLEDLEPMPELVPHLQWVSAHFQSIMAVPLLVKDRVYGSLALYYPESREFSEEHLQLAASFGDQASLAIENADLRRRAEETAAAAERSRLARDLHDAVTQTLFSASLIAEVLPRIWERDREKAKERLLELRQLTRAALAEMRTLLLELRPAALAEAELPELLQQLVDAARGRARIPVTLEISGGRSLPQEVRVALFRIAQEALNNVTRHSNAKSAFVRLELGLDEVGLTISDDGRGFSVDAAPSERLGLGIMAERAQDIGANLDVKSAPGRGTRIEVRWRDSAPETAKGD